MRRLSVGRRLRRPVHRQHHGLRLEAIGLALPAPAGAPAPYVTRDQYAEASGEAVMNLLRLDIRPRDICTREAFENAARRRRRHRRLDQRRAAPAGDGA